MFAVKGWAVDASTLKPQTEPIKSGKNRDVPEPQPGEKASRKRKREFNATTAPEADIGEKWEKHIEGKSKPKNKKDRKKQKKEQEAAEDVNGFAAAMQSKAQEEQTAKQEDAPAPDTAGEFKPEKKNKRRKPKDRESEAQDGVAAPNLNNALSGMPPPPPALPASAKLTPMQAAMRQKLISARFRHLNETLYTAPSADAEQLFTSNPSMFEDYHAGFRQQVAVWPENPVDNFIATIRARGKVKQTFQKKGVKPKTSEGPSDGALTALPRTHGTAIIADLGCGDARLASTLTTSNETSSLNLKLHSFDLHSPSRFVTKSDISNLPLEDNAADVAIFCLALMGTNWISFIEEAYRILHWKGELWVAEIKSRFGRVGGKSGKGKVVEHSVGSKRKAKAMEKINEAKAKENQEVNEQEVLATEVDGVEAQPQQETDVSAFVEVLKRRGFLLKEGEKSVDLSNKMFVKMEFIKAAAPTKGKGKKGEPEERGNSKPGFQKKKFLEEKAAEEPSTEDETKVLKPCLYKIR